MGRNKPHNKTLIRAHNKPHNKDHNKALIMVITQGPSNI